MNKYVQEIRENTAKMVAKYTNSSFRAAMKTPIIDLDAKLNAAGIKEGFGGSGMSYLLDTIVQNIVLKSYELAYGVIRDVCLVDTSAKSLTQKKNYYTVGDVMDMPRRNRKGGYEEIKPVSDGRVQALPETYGYMVRFDATDTLDDVFNTQSRILVKMGEGAKQLEDNVGFTYIKTQDSAICTSALGNLTTAAISQTALEAGVQALAEQTNDESQYIFSQAKFLLGGPATMLTREKLCRNAFEVGTSNYAQDNLMKGRFIALTTQYLTGNEWFLLADPNRVEIFLMYLLEAFGGEPVISKQIPDTKVISGKGSGLLEDSSFNNLTINYKVDHALDFQVLRTDGIGIYGKIV